MNPSRIAAASSFDVDRYLPLPPSVADTPAILVTANVQVRDAVRTIRCDRPDLPFEEVIHLDYSGVIDRIPHGVPWSSFPVLTEPRCQFYSAVTVGDLVRYDSSGHRPHGSRISTDDFRLLVERARDIFLVVGPPPADRTDTHTPDEMAYRVLSATKSSRGRSCRVTAFTADDGGYGVETAPASTRARFLASYALNFRILAGRAYDNVTRRFDMRSPLQVSYRSFDDPWTTHDVGHPLFLQILYAIRRGNLVEDDGEDLLIRRFLRHGRGEPSFAWPGTGKHPPYVTGYRTFSSLQRQIWDLGLVDDIETGTRFARLSPAGEGFLDLLHPDCEDPDVLCRWVGMDDGEIGSAMDAYVVKFFSKLKNRVDRLPGRPE